MDELKMRMTAYENLCPILLQEYFQGSGQGVELLSYEGRPLAAFQHKRLCEVPPSGGASAFRESVALTDQLMMYPTKLTQALGWSGLIMVEFKVGDDGAKLMEINGRVWGSLPLAVASGVDFPGLLADLYSMGPTSLVATPLTDYNSGIRLVNPDLMLAWFGRVLLGRRDYPNIPFPPRRRVFSVLLQLLSRRVGFDIFSWDDPNPDLTEGRRLVHKVLGKIRGGNK
jgi:predicted ATP-grasp superfamily ATP-dependent carboligase